LLIAKAMLLRTVKALGKFDPTGSPYIGIQWGELSPLFHRSSDTGFIQSIGFMAGEPLLIVSLSHITSILSNTTADEIDMREDRNGILTLTGTTERGVDELRVHTIRQSITWAKQHWTGAESVEIPFGGFKGINTAPFDLASPPVLRRNRLMLPTNYGVVIRSNVPVEAHPYPRESFLRSVSALPVQRVVLTREGYWAASTDTLRVVVAGHRQGDAMFDTYSGAALPLADLPAERLLQCLKYASDIAAPSSRVTIDPARGVQAIDNFNHINSFTLGDTGSWGALSIKPRTAKVIFDALGQTTEENTNLQQMNVDTMRLVRGAWEVSFKVFPVDTTKSS